MVVFCFRGATGKGCDFFRVGGGFIVMRERDLLGLGRWFLPRKEEFGIICVVNFHWKTKKKSEKRWFFDLTTDKLIHARALAPTKTPRKSQGTFISLWNK